MPPANGLHELWIVREDDRDDRSHKHVAFLVKKQDENAGFLHEVKKTIWPPEKYQYQYMRRVDDISTTYKALNMFKIGLIKDVDLPDRSETTTNKKPGMKQFDQLLSMEDILTNCSNDPAKPVWDSKEWCRRALVSLLFARIVSEDAAKAAQKWL